MGVLRPSHRRERWRPVLRRRLDGAIYTEGVANDPHATRWLMTCGRLDSFVADGEPGNV
jgi:hypothetical protein